MTGQGPELISVDLKPYGLVPELGNVFIKDWSEHAGLAANLDRAGFVRTKRLLAIRPYAGRCHEIHAYEVAVLGGDGTRAQEPHAQSRPAPDRTPDQPF